MDGLFGGIEAGGTKFVCAAGAGPDDLRVANPIETETPDQTLKRVARFFQQWSGSLAAIGIGCFGPVDLKSGKITSTPKAGWANYELVREIRQHLGLPDDFAIAIDTDVNAAALGEYRWGAAQGLANFIYLTVGTGIGGGGMISGRLMRGLVHPEMGHIRIPHDWNVDDFQGSCPYHRDCLEGLASGPALAQRWSKSPESLPADHPAWELEAHYLALGLANFICTLSPERIIMGGGVMRQPRLLPLVRQKVQDLLSGYIGAPQILNEIDSYIVPPRLGDRSGVLGAIALAQEAWSKK